MQIEKIKKLQSTTCVPKNHVKNDKIRSPGAPKSRKMEARGTPKRQQNAKLEKMVVVLNSLAPFLSILIKNGSQDGGQNPFKIDEKLI